MTERKRGLGRGLSALIGDTQAVSVVTPLKTDAPTADGLHHLDIDRLQPGQYQPRKHFNAEELQALAASLMRTGMVQPIVARPLAGDDGKYEIIAGERRWRAAQIAKLHRVPVLVQALDDAAALELAIIENVQRTDLNPVEESGGYRRLMDEFAYTQADLAQTIGKSRPHIANMLRLAQAGDKIKAHLIAGRLSAGHARALLGHPKADALADKIIAEGLNVRAAEKLAADKNTHNKSKAKQATKSKDVNTQALEKTLADNLGLSVAIADRGDRGDVRIAYRSLEQFDMLVNRLMGR